MRTYFGTPLQEKPNHFSERWQEAENQRAMAMHNRVGPDVQKETASTPGGFVRNKHAHYFKDVTGLQTVDVYRVLELFGVTDPALGHAIKKLLVAGGRGAGKSIEKDIQESIDTLERWQVMRKEDAERAPWSP